MERKEEKKEEGGGDERRGKKKGEEAPFLSFIFLLFLSSFSFPNGYKSLHSLETF